MQPCFLLKLLWTTGNETKHMSFWKWWYIIFKHTWPFLLPCRKYQGFLIVFCFVLFYVSHTNETQVKMKLECFLYCMIKWIQKCIGSMHLCEWDWMRPKWKWNGNMFSVLYDENWIQKYSCMMKSEFWSRLVAHTHHSQTKQEKTGTIFHQTLKFYHSSSKVSKISFE